jgi:hypothetical protein
MEVCTSGLRWGAIIGDWMRSAGIVRQAVQRMKMKNTQLMKMIHVMLISFVQRRRNGSDGIGVGCDNGRIVSRLSMIGSGNLD